MNNTLTAIIATGMLFALDELQINPWVAAFVALAVGFFVAWRMTRRHIHGR